LEVIPSQNLLLSGLTFSKNSDIINISKERKQENG
jgi:hypothetical protein